MNTKRIFALLLVVSFLAAAAVSLSARSDAARRMACRNNMAQVAGAKGGYGLENKLPRGQSVSPDEISPYLKHGWSGLVCPSGGRYDPGRFTGNKDDGTVKQAPSCSIHGSLATLEAEQPEFSAQTNRVLMVSGVCAVVSLLMACFCFKGCCGSKCAAKGAAESPTPPA